MKRRTFLSALVGAGTVAATTSYIARHMTPPPPKAQDMSKYFTSKDAWYIKPEHDRGIKRFIKGSDLNQESLERMLEALKTDFVDRGKMIVVRPTKLLVKPEKYAELHAIYGSST
jgi:hypothetical protein